MNAGAREAIILAKNIKWPIPKQSGYTVKGLGRAYLNVWRLARVFKERFEFDDTLETAAKKVQAKEIEELSSTAAAVKKEFSGKRPALEHLAFAASNRSFVLEVLGIARKAGKECDLALEIADRTDIITQFLEKADEFIAGLEKFVRGKEGVAGLRGRGG